MKKIALISVCVLGLAIAGNAQAPAKKEAPAAVKTEVKKVEAPAVKKEASTKNEATPKKKKSVVAKTDAKKVEAPAAKTNAATPVKK